MSVFVICGLLPITLCWGKATCCIWSATWVFGNWGDGTDHPALRFFFFLSKLFIIRSSFLPQQLYSYCPDERIMNFYPVDMLLSDPPSNILILPAEKIESL